MGVPQSLVVSSGLLAALWRTAGAAAAASAAVYGGAATAPVCNVTQDVTVPAAWDATPTTIDVDDSSGLAVGSLYAQATTSANRAVAASYVLVAIVDATHVTVRSLGVGLAGAGRVIAGGTTTLRLLGSVSPYIDFTSLAFASNGITPENAQALALSVIRWFGLGLHDTAHALVIPEPTADDLAARVDASAVLGSIWLAALLAQVYIKAIDHGKAYAGGAPASQGEGIKIAAIGAGVGPVVGDVLAVAYVAGFGWGSQNPAVALGEAPGPSLDAAGLGGGPPAGVFLAVTS